MKYKTEVIRLQKELKVKDDIIAGFQKKFDKLDSAVAVLTENVNKISAVPKSTEAVLNETVTPAKQNIGEFPAADRAAYFIEWLKELPEENAAVLAEEYGIVVTKEEKTDSEQPVTKVKYMYGGKEVTLKIGGSHG